MSTGTMRNLKSKFNPCIDWERERERLHYEVKWTKLHSLEGKLNQIIIKVFRLWLYTRREYKLNIFLNINCNCIILVIGVSSYDGTVLHLLFTVFFFFSTSHTNHDLSSFMIVFFVKSSPDIFKHLWKWPMLKLPHAQCMITKTMGLVWAGIFRAFLKN